MLCGSTTESTVQCYDGEPEDYLGPEDVLGPVEGGVPRFDSD